MVSMGIEHYNQSRVVTFTLEICNALFTTIFSLGKILHSFIIQKKENPIIFISFISVHYLYYIKAALGFTHIFSCLVTARASDHLQNLDHLWNDTNTKYQFIHSNFTVMNNYYVRQVLGGIITKKWMCIIQKGQRPRSQEKEGLKG